jgi:hypothetical protein
MDMLTAIFVRHELGQTWRAVRMRIHLGMKRLDRRLASLEQAAHAFLLRTAVYRFTRVDVNAKCPACGHRLGRIEFASDLRLIRHVCLVCAAAWGERPVVDPTYWIK